MRKAAVCLEADAPGADAPGADAPGADAPGADAPGADAPGADESPADLSEGVTVGLTATVIGHPPCLLAPAPQRLGWNESGRCDRTDCYTVTSPLRELRNPLA